MSNPLDNMTWEQRFYAAFDALLKMEQRAEDAERKLQSSSIVAAIAQEKHKHPGSVKSTTIVRTQSHIQADRLQQRRREMRAKGFVRGWIPATKLVE